MSDTPSPLTPNPTNATTLQGMPRVVAVQVGRVAPLGPKSVPSAFIKRPVTGPVTVRQLGLEGDEQADLTVHGGPDKAVYAYASAHFPAWAADFPEHTETFAPGAFGENLTIAGLTEADLCVGDVHVIGTARLQVCQPRQPCFKFALRFDDKRMPRAMVRSKRSGWYYRVLVEGTLKAGDPVIFAARPDPTLAFSRLVEIVYGAPASPDELSWLAQADGVARWLRVQARDSLA